MLDDYEPISAYSNPCTAAENYCHRIGEDSLYRMLLMRIIEASVDRIRSLLATMKNSSQTKMKILNEWEWLNSPSEGLSSHHRGFTFRELCRFLDFDPLWMREKILSQFSQDQINFLDLAAEQLEEEQAAWSIAQRTKHILLLDKLQEASRKREERDERKAQLRVAKELARTARQLEHNRKQQIQQTASVLPSPRPRKAGRQDSLVHVGQNGECNCHAGLNTARGGVTPESLSKENTHDLPSEQVFL